MTPSIHTHTSIFAVSILTLAACPGETPDPVAVCDTAGGAGCGSTGVPPAPPACADPEFGMTPTTPTEFSCEGRAGGAIVYLQNEWAAGGGPGSIQTDPAVTEFPSMGNNVAACCDEDLDPDPVELDEACQYDCGRAACNRILDALRAAAMSSDPSGGECDGAGWVDPEHGGKDGCQNKVRGSLESWITQLEVRYDDCVKAAVFNSNSALAYTEHSEPFDDNGKIEFEDWSCSQIAAGCFFDAELRPFCEIDDFTEQSTCAQAGNPVDANASGDGGGVDESGDGGDGGVAPFGDIGALADCAAAPPYELYCNIDEDLRYNVAYNFHIVYEEGVTMTHGTWGTGVTGLKVTGLDSGEHSKTLFNELGVVNNDVITHVNNTALATWGDVLDIIDEVTGAATMEITVRRFKCVVSCSWGTRNYYYTPPLTFGELNGEAGADPSLAAAQGNANGDGVDANEGHGCGCTQQAAPGGIALFGLGLLGLGRRRRRATQELIRTGRPRRTV